MYCYQFQVVYQEVPNEISLCFSISGCPLRCEGCHSPFLFKKGGGVKLDDELYLSKLNEYRDYATSVLFMGGEWEKEELIAKLKIAKELEYKTCLYTGLEQVDDRIMRELTWIKTGRWIQELGGLESKNTNQIFKEIETNNILNNLFIK